MSRRGLSASVMLSLQATQAALADFSGHPVIIMQALVNNDELGELLKEKKASMRKIEASLYKVRFEEIMVLGARVTTFSCTCSISRTAGWNEAMELELECNGGTKMFYFAKPTQGSDGGLQFVISRK